MFNIAKLTAVLDEQLKDLKDALGVSEVEVKSDENGTEIEAKDESEKEEKDDEEVDDTISAGAMFSWLFNDVYWL